MQHLSMAANPEEEEEEAVRLKTLAESKYKESNLESALQYATQAKSLNQNLDGISELVTTYTILHEASSSSSSSSPPPNYYKILQVESFSPINIIKKQYRKLALTLHPDKNTCPASEDAFKHVSEAFRLLSDKIRKKDFDVSLRIAMQSEVAAAAAADGGRGGDETGDVFAAICSGCESVHRFERKFVGQSLVCPRCGKGFVAEEEIRVDDDDELDDRTSRRKRKATITGFMDRMGLKSKPKKAKIAKEMTLSEIQSEAKRKNDEERKKREEMGGAEMDTGKEKRSKVKETYDKVKCQHGGTPDKVGNAKGKKTLKEMAEKLDKERKKKKMDIVQNTDEKTMTLKEMVEEMEEEKKTKTVENTGKLKEKRVRLKDISEILGEEKAMTLKEMLGEMEKKKEKKIKTLETTGKDTAKGGETSKERTLTLKEMVEKLGKAKGKDKLDEPGKAKEKEKVEEPGKAKDGDKVEEPEKVKDNDKVEEPEKAKNEDKVEKKYIRKKRGKEKKKKDKGKEISERVVAAISERSSDLEAMVVKDSDLYSFDKVEEPEKAKDEAKVEKKNIRKKKGKEEKKKKKAKGKEMEERVVAAISERSSDLEAMVVEDSDFYSFDKDRSERCFKKCQIWAAYGDNDGMPRHYGLVDEVISLNPFKVKVSWLDLQGKRDDISLCPERSGCQISCGKFKVDGKTVVNSVNMFSHIVKCERVAREIYMIYPKKGSVWALYGGSDRHETNQVNVVNGRYDIVVILTNYSEMHGLSIAYLDKVKWFKTIFERREIGGHAVRWLEKDNVRLFSHQIPSRKLLGTEAPGLPKDCWELDPAALPQDLLVVEKDYLLGAA